MIKAYPAMRRDGQTSKTSIETQRLQLQLERYKILPPPTIRFCQRVQNFIHCGNTQLSAQRLKLIHEAQERYLGKSVRFWMVHRRKPAQKLLGVVAFIVPIPLYKQRAVNSMDGLQACVATPTGDFLVPISILDPTEI